MDSTQYAPPSSAPNGLQPHAVAGMHPIVLLTPPSAEQTPAVLTLECDVVLTAGAGTGKTRTLVARVLQLLASGTPPRSIFAVTFTVKAAREMRNRLRREIAAYLAQPALSAAEAAFWNGIVVELESARIGTIHSLCAEILRAHPAEANVDPAFAVLDEAVALQLRDEAIVEALGWAADDPQALALFALFGPDDLEELLVALLADRLKVQRLLAAQPWEGWELRAAELLDAALARPDLCAALAAVEDWEASGAVAAAARRDDTLAPFVQMLLVAWRELQDHRAGGDLEAALACLPRLRSATPLNKGRSANWPQEPKPVMAAVRTAYDLHLAHLAAGVDFGLDRALAQAMPQLRALFARAVMIYTARKQERHALDFDDLEQGVLDLLRNDPEVCMRWREEAAALLIDEFQDTNERQRELVDLLNAGRGRLFIVGDAKQSIYRFRGAEVEVFRLARREIAAHGLACDLASSHRTHHALLETLNCLLACIMGEEEIDGEPWHEPFAALAAVRAACSLPFSGPYVELHLAVGTKSDGALDRAAAALAQRLQALVGQSDEQLGYGDIAVLCRGARSFGAYEDAFEAAGIPYETVAGRGFLERPEIRDLLNALTALADPSDDLALYGLLRSPAMFLPDTELHRLRFAGGIQPGSLWRALCIDPAPSSRRAAELIGVLHDRAGRVAVADLLKQLVDATHYRAALLAAGDARAARNVGKLLQDAQRSGIVGVGEFLQYVKGLRAAGSREGEARADSRGAVQIMTVHQAKGLEFPVVVLGDAGSTPSGGGDLLLDGALGVVPYLKRDQLVPLTWQLARRAEERKEAAETNRLLYVAATRAQERLLVSGCANLKATGELTAGGWLKAVCAAAGIRQAPPGFDPQHSALADLNCEPPANWPGPAAVCGTIYGEAYVPDFLGGSGQPEQAAPGGEEAAPCLLAPVAGSNGEIVPGAGNEGAPDRIWRVAPRTATRWCPAWVIGKLVHAAIAAWRWPDESDFAAWCTAAAHTYGLGSGPQVDDALRRTRRLLRQLRLHPLYAEMAAADERYHELPYTSPDGEGPYGQIDLLFRRGESWTLVDFKTDRIRDEHGHVAMVEVRGYREQVARYAAAVEHYLGVSPRCLLCLLDDRGAVSAIPIRAPLQGVTSTAEVAEPAGAKLEEDTRHAEWELVCEYANSVCGKLLQALYHAGVPVPEVGFDLLDARGRVMATSELAWPEQHITLFLLGQESELLLAEQAGWRTLLMDETDDAHATARALIAMLKVTH